MKHTLSVPCSVCAYVQTCSLKYERSHLSTCQKKATNGGCVWTIDHKHVAIRHKITLMSRYHRAPPLLSWQQLIWQTGEFSTVIPEATLSKM